MRRLSFSQMLAILAPGAALAAVLGSQSMGPYIPAIALACGAFFATIAAAAARRGASPSSVFFAVFTAAGIIAIAAVARGEHDRAACAAGQNGDDSICAAALGVGLVIAVSAIALALAVGGIAAWIVHHAQTRQRVTLASS